MLTGFRKCNQFHLISTFQLQLLCSVLDLTNQCLTYDFTGSNSVDEANDEIQTVQVPAQWRNCIVDTEIVPMLFEMYLLLNGDMASKVCPTIMLIYLQPLSCIVQLASVRRTLFNTNERPTFLQHFLNGVKLVFENSQNLTNQSTYHEFCRLLHRLKVNFQLSELMKIEDYPKLMLTLTEFSVTSLQVC